MNRLYKYYLTQSAPERGAFPKGAISAQDYNGIYKVPHIGPAFGFVTFNRPLPPEQIKQYKLIAE